MTSGSSYSSICLIRVPSPNTRSLSVLLPIPDSTGATHVVIVVDQPELSPPTHLDDQQLGDGQRLGGLLALLQSTIINLFSYIQ